jgi:uncharacterized protein (TIGR02646 family)
MAFRGREARVVAVIPVSPCGEPVAFDAAVRQPGLRWLKRRGIPLGRKLDHGVRLEPYWRACLRDLHQGYGGVCAYLCVFVERITGGASVDHFVAKSRKAALAYEWDNYRLACTTMNSRKRDFDTVLDPFELSADTFRLEPITGRIYANPDLSPPARRDAERTIERLGLDDGDCREMRARHYEEYRRGEFGSGYLRKRSPFVWFEARRQGLL